MKPLTVRLPDDLDPCHRMIQIASVVSGGRARAEVRDFYTSEALSVGTWEDYRSLTNVAPEPRMADRIMDVLPAWTPHPGPVVDLAGLPPETKWPEIRQLGDRHPELHLGACLISADGIRFEPPEAT